ncbi:hypothetical protein [Aquamicrobium sp. LC103]|uniref:hypothetical protein n=1 Tax=Aquamicrobium sp. LC103 TaxID=1120658 RepID=UPI00063EBAEA|nr:hypothetical protein [Aquamicrobium sp. LC103]TKT69204.1 hypothetical protein XW59_028115 [Aquamicrobium sp. LC103]
MKAPTIPAIAFPIVFGDNARHRLCCRRDQPIRLHHLGRILPASDSLLSGGSKEDILVAALKRQCAPWDRTLLRLIDRYFEFLRRRLQDNLPEIKRRLGYYEGLYRSEDTLFSAPALLPRARVKTSGLEDVPIAAAIWSGEKLTALFEGRVGETPRHGREYTRKLEAAGIAIKLTEPEATASSDDAFFDALLGPELRHFFHTEPLPCAPLPPDLAPGFLARQLSAPAT